MAVKGQKFKLYPESIKREAIRLHLEEKWSHRHVAEHLGINDKNRVKAWVRWYRERGEKIFVDRRGNPHRLETEGARKLRRLEMEVAVLKKFGYLEQGGVVVKHKVVDALRARYHTAEFMLISWDFTKRLLQVSST